MKTNTAIKNGSSACNRPNQDFRGYAGTINSGTLKKAQNVKILPSGNLTEVDKIFDLKRNKKCKYKSSNYIDAQR